MVTIGGSLVTGLTALGEGMNKFFIDQYSTLAANVVVAYPNSKSFRINEQVVQNIRRAAFVRDVVPFIQQSALVEAGGTAKSLNVVGIDQSKLPLIYPTLKIADGKLVDPRNSLGAIVGQLAANPPDKPMPFARTGQAINIRYNHLDAGKPVTSSRSFRVEGVLDSLGATGFFPVDKMTAISLPAANALFKREGSYDAVFVIASSYEIVEEVLKSLQRLYGKDLEVFSAKSIIDTIRRAIASFQIFLSAIAGVSLVVAGVGIFTGQYTSVIERTREIGLMKALGFNNLAVLFVFLTEAAVVGAVGGVLGDAVGVGISYIFADYISNAPWGEGGQTLGQFSPLFTWDMFVWVWAFCTAVSIVAGMYPAWRAAKLDPVVALRYE